LQTKSGILRGESVYKGELSDMLTITMQGENDPHPLELLILKIATGKTNKNLTLYGRCMRCADVRMCAFGAFGFYLMYRFEQTHEMDVPPDFLDNAAWFDVKLLTDMRSHDNTKAVTDQTYQDSIKVICRDLGIATNHYLHLGRVMGAVELEQAEVESEAIRQLGNWDPKIQETRYSSKIPLKTIRKMGRFRAADGMHFNPRTVMMPGESLERMIFPFADACLEKVLAKCQEDGKDRWTAIHTLRLWIKLRRIILQDAAVILEYYPARSAHPLFRHAVFQTPAFSEFRLKMRRAIDTTEIPMDVKLHAVLPGLHDRLRGMHGDQSRGFDEVRDELKQLGNQISKSADTAAAVVRVEMAKHFAALAVSLAQGSPFQGLAAAAASQVVVDNGANDGSTQAADAMPDLPHRYLGYGHKLTQTHASVEAIYEQWYGLGSFSGVPVEGGIAAMELKTKTHWRALENGVWTSGQAKHFSRMEQVVRAIKSAEEKQPDKSLVDILADFQAIFLEKHGAFSTFVEALKTKHLVPKKGTSK
jgi:hypothetical protein